MNTQFRTQARTPVFTLATLLISLGFSFPAFAGNPAQLRQLLETRECRGCDLTNVDLRQAHLIGADLREANLSGAALQEANLEGADLTGANLAGANLTQAYLNSAELTNANLTQANLTEANLIRASLDGANVLAAQVNGVNVMVAEWNKTNGNQEIPPRVNLAGVVKTVDAVAMPSVSAADLGNKEVFSLESNPFILAPSIGGPDLGQPFSYSPEFFQEFSPAIDINSPTHFQIESGSYDTFPLNWTNPDGSFKGTSRQMRLRLDIEQ